MSEMQTGPTEERRSYLGASDIAAVLGIAPYSTALDVWAEKVHGIGVTDNEPMRIGRELERPVLSALYAKPRGLLLRYPGTWRHPSEPWMAATPDAFAGRENQPIDRTAECKIVGRRQMHRWGDADQGPDGIPPEVLCQVTWQLAAVRAGAELLDSADFLAQPLESADVVALLGTELRIYGVAFDADFAANLMEAGRAWWRRHVEKGEMPEVYAENATRLLARIHPKGVEGTLVMTEDVRALAGQWMRAAAAEKSAEAEKGQLAAKLCAQIGDADGFAEPGLKVTWFERRGSISYKKIVDDLGVPEAEREEYRGDPTRVLRVTGTTEE